MIETTERRMMKMTMSTRTMVKTRMRKATMVSA